MPRQRLTACFQDVVLKFGVIFVKISATLQNHVGNH